MERLQRSSASMLRAEQLAAVGQLAAGVAHEVRNPLTGMKMLVEAALRPAGRHAADRARTCASSTARSPGWSGPSSSFLDFARPPPLQRAAGRPARRRRPAGRAGPRRARQQEVAVASRCPTSRCRCGSTPARFRRCWSTCCSTPSTPCRAAAASTSAWRRDGRRGACCASRDTGPGIAAGAAPPAVHAVRQHQADRHRAGAEPVPPHRRGARRHASTAGNRPERRGLLRRHPARLAADGGDGDACRGCWSSTTSRASATPSAASSRPTAWRCCTAAHRWPRACEAFAREPPDVVVLDLQLPDGSGWTCSASSAPTTRGGRSSSSPAHGTTETAIEAMKRGRVRLPRQAGRSGAAQPGCSAGPSRRPG